MRRLLMEIYEVELEVNNYLRMRGIVWGLVLHVPVDVDGKGKLIR